jgi:hypothetical protein
MILSALRRRPQPATPAPNMPPPGPASPCEGHPTAGRSGSGSILSVPAYQRLRQVVLAVAIVGGPLAYVVGGVLASFLLPIGAVGLAQLAYPGAPWLATIGGLLAVVGWLPFSALAALDDLASTMAQLPNGASYAGLLDRFSTDAVMSSYLLIYVVGHLVAYVLLGIALRRGRVIPRWAAGSMIASSPLTVTAFVVPGSPRAVGGVALALLVLGSLPAARHILSAETPVV